VRELEASLVPAERDAWRCVWQEGPGMEWDDFFWTALTGEEAWQRPGQMVVV
jgi:hypothetical protein